MSNTKLGKLLNKFESKNDNVIEFESSDGEVISLIRKGKDYTIFANNSSTSIPPSQVDDVKDLFNGLTEQVLVGPFELVNESNLISLGFKGTMYYPELSLVAMRKLMDSKK